MQRNAYIQLFTSMRDGKATERLPSSIVDGEASKPENSYSETWKLRCPKCGVEYGAKLWLLIDVYERPDLLLSAAKGDLHRVACPDGHSGELDLPLLTYVKGFKPRIFFSGRLASDPEETANDNFWLINVLMNKISPGVDPNWSRDDIYAIMPGQRQSTLLEVARCLSQLTERNQEEGVVPSRSPIAARRIDFLDLESKEDLEKYLIILTYAPNLWNNVRSGDKIDIRELISRGRDSNDLENFRELIAFLNEEKQESELSDAESWLAGGLADILYATIQDDAGLFKEHIPMLGPHQRLYTLLILILFEEPITGIPMYINDAKSAGLRLLSCSK